MNETEKADDEVDTYHAWDCSPAELTAEIERLKAEIERMRYALEMVAALPSFEPEEPYGQAVLGALMSRINYILNNNEENKNG